MIHHRKRRAQSRLSPPSFLAQHNRDRRLRRGEALIMRVAVVVSAALITDSHIPPDVREHLLAEGAHDAVRTRLAGQRTPYTYDLQFVGQRLILDRNAVMLHYRVVIRAAQGVTVPSHGTPIDPRFHRPDPVP